MKSRPTIADATATRTWRWPNHSVIDGSTLEGGGQVIRTALSLAWVQKSRPLSPPALSIRVK